jgi:hypothetical protein
MFSLISGRQIQKINIYTKTNMIICKLICPSFLQQWNYSVELREEGKE